MDHRDRAAPVALARDAPVAQAEIDLALGDGTVAVRLGLEPPRHRLMGLGRRHAVEERRIDHPPLAVIGDVADLEGRRVLALGAHHRYHRQPVFAHEVEVALVMRRAAEDGARAVLHQDEVGDIDRQLTGRIERMHGSDAGVVAELLGGIDRLLRRAGALALGDERLQRRVPSGGGAGQRMVRGDRHEGGAEQRVGPRRVDDQFAFAVGGRRVVEREADLQAFRPADPVLLHQPDLLRPAVERVEGGQEILRIVGDLEEPLRQLADLDHGARAPAAAVDDLLIGEHRLVDGIPVDLRDLALDEAGGQEVEEHRLLVLVVGRVAGRDLAAPVERQAHRFELRPHRRDVGIGPCGGMLAAVHGGALGRQAEGVPSHRMQDVEALGALVACDDVAHGVVADMAHMDAPRRIGEHLEHVVALAAGRRWASRRWLARPISPAIGARLRGHCSARSWWRLGSWD